MHEEIRVIKQEYDDALTHHPEETLAWLLGGCIDGLAFDQMLPFWMISGNAINRIYREVVQGRSGIGKQVNFRSIYVSRGEACCCQPRDLNHMNTTYSVLGRSKTALKMRQLFVIV